MKHVKTCLGGITFNNIRLLMRLFNQKIWSRRLLHLHPGNTEQILPQKATALGKVLHADILFSGPITIAEYMRQCLTHPKHGYYTTRRDVFGATGDFVTSPQISPVFSEMLAVWIANYVSKDNSTRNGDGSQLIGTEREKRKRRGFRLVELGPGCGSLQKALLPALARFGCTPTSLFLVDASPVLREKQRIALESLPKAVVPKVTWYASADQGLAALDKDRQNESIVDNDDETRERTIFLAHEFFDALPVHIFKRVQSPTSRARTGSQGQSSQWRELLVDAVPEDQQRAALRLVTAPTHTPACALIPLINPTPDENIIEVSPETLSLTRRLAHVVNRDDGAALIIDYGHTSRRNNTTTLRAIKHHQQTHFLQTPGLADLTADVDFAAISAYLANQNIQFLGATTQRLFLLRLGIAQRMRVLAHSVIQNYKDPNVVDQKLIRLQQDYDRLVGQSESDMGHIYKVAAICPPGTGSLPGFEDSAVSNAQSK